MDLYTVCRLLIVIVKISEAYIDPCRNDSSIIPLLRNDSILYLGCTLGARLAKAEDCETYYECGPMLFNNRSGPLLWRQYRCQPGMMYNYTAEQCQYGDDNSMCFDKCRCSNSCLGRYGI